ncbi:MauE/DoxX family redox-associated membrane protein [Micromonospora okii]|uniref:MauE/DoxX family redox-associated membrane protein n=1 Tax=Micromonospora okii TaxID=1182970 RepID=UPI001E4510AA|nr:MauE/DoxX family redox-associated membrane protein [Micromonospora okii]
MPYLALAVRCLIGAVFLASALSKVSGRRALPAFVASLRALRLLPARAVKPVAVLIVATEFTLCGLLAAPVPTAAAVGLAGAAALLLVFAAGIGTAVRRGTSAPCRCFGASTTPLGGRHVARNLLLAGIAGLAAPATAPGVGGATPTGLLLAATAGLVVAALVVALDDLAALFTAVPQRPTGDSPRGH